MEDFKYDVAFSFTQQDESLATELFTLLEGGLRCFLYSEAQKELAARNGEDMLQSVYEKDSRVVVILYREEYGNTKWTRIEETAIRNRGFEEGYDFVVLIPMHKKVGSPKWLPRNRLWVGLERWGIESAASVIEAKVQEAGGTVLELSMADIAAEKEKKIADAKERERRKTVQNAELEINTLNEELQSQMGEIEKKLFNWKLKIRKNQRNSYDVFYYGFTLSIYWYQQNTNFLEGSSLSVRIINGSLDEHGNLSDPYSDNTLVETESYNYEINEFNEPGWLSKKTQFFTTKKLVYYWLSLLISVISDKRTS